MLSRRIATSHTRMDFDCFFPLDRKDCKSMLEHDWKRHFLNSLLNFIYFVET